MKRSIVSALCMLALAGTPAGAQPGVRTVIRPRALCCTDGVSYVPPSPGHRRGALIVNQAALDQIVRIDLATRQITVIGGEADGSADELVTPDDNWLDPLTGDLYTTEILTGGVRRIAPDGTRTRVLAGFQDDFAFPNSITGLRRPGQPLRLFVAVIQFEPERHAGIYEVDPAGVVPPRLVYGAIANTDVFGTGFDAEAFQFDPQGAELYAPNTYGGDVLAIDVDAHTARTVWNGDGGNGISARFALDGSLLYADQATGRILRLDPHGGAGQTPELVAQLAPGVDGIAPAPDGRIYATNFHRGGVDVIEADGSTHPLIAASLDLPMGIAPLPNGLLAIADLGSVAYVDGGIARPQMFIRDDLDIVLGVAARGACDVYATGFFRGVLQHVDACNPSKKRVEVVPRHSFGIPGDIAIAGDEAWIVDWAGVVWRVGGLDGDNPAASIEPLPGAFANPSGIAVGGGALYVGEDLTGTVRVVDPQTGAPIDVLTGFDEPEGLAYDAGDLLVVEAGAGRLTRVHPDGKRETVADGLSTQIRGVSVVPVINFYADVALAGDGTIYVTLPATGELLRIGE